LFAKIRKYYLQTNLYRFNKKRPHSSVQPTRIILETLSSCCLSVSSNRHIFLQIEHASIYITLMKINSHKYDINLHYQIILKLVI